MEATTLVVSPMEASACSSRRIAAEIVDAYIHLGSAMEQTAESRINFEFPNNRPI